MHAEEKQGGHTDVISVDNGGEIPGRGAERLFNRSSSNPQKQYTVTLDFGGNYRGCRQRLNNIKDVPNALPVHTGEELSLRPVSNIGALEGFAPPLENRFLQTMAITLWSMQYRRRQKAKMTTTGEARMWM
ncbi:hypothetical protein PGT21_025667 [Puccinia graminis f. sp. tritici]|uniref:Uncharacterized protein n=1 Tax=Puccinia graminis f. sp. tritici TaxID=56615 RepID=A0A5B0NWI6_PUCGR|nr:hypothetical protein PGT21_025667 [Puccinia graminis f. sp. tritici]KAA1135001.1 hypothetical protein PGTUg99_005622 [Puccinia graminis f. sp. tritici]